ncbi:CIC11C00000000341 [Sungouiella intermedia]|uniref:CIC11C00000000341 n=1 Tax=Sungouiella intermedia TaxID=45354 RepID=A0A1L0BG65_9ASCO|nr:CIC11C00000000341 [[Candida] intermedia]
MTSLYPNFHLYVATEKDQKRPGDMSETCNTSIKGSVCALFSKQRTSLTRIWATIMGSDQRRSLIVCMIGHLDLPFLAAGHNLHSVSTVPTRALLHGTRIPQLEANLPANFGGQRLGILCGCGASTH